MGGGAGEGRPEGNIEGSCHKWPEVRGREREVPGHRKVLTTSSLPSSFSHEPSQPGLTPSPGVGCREKRPERGKCVLLLTVGLSGLPCRRKDRSQGTIGAKGLWEPGGTTWTHQESRAEGLGRSLDRRELRVLPGHERSGDRLWGPICLGSEAASVS